MEKDIWISVNDRLPEEETNVFIGKDEYVSMGWLEDQKWNDHQNTDESKNPIEVFPTHWAPLPPPPKNKQ